MKRTIITIKSISLSDVTNYVFCLQIDPESLYRVFRRADNTVTCVRASSKAENGNTYFNCFFYLLNKKCRNKVIRDANRV